MAILNKGIISKEEGSSDLGELRRAMAKMEDGEYAYYICDKKKNKSMPMLKFLFGVVLKAISNEHGGTTEELYRIYEEMFAPVKIVELDGQEYMVRNAKKLPRDEFAKFIEQIIDHANDFFHTTIPQRDELAMPEMQDEYVESYNEMWEDFNRKI